jgi:hypothetical protein
VVDDAQRVCIHPVTRSSSNLDAGIMNPWWKQGDLASKSEHIAVDVRGILELPHLSSLALKSQLAAAEMKEHPSVT